MKHPMQRTGPERDKFLALPPTQRVKEVGHRAYVGGSGPEGWYGRGLMQYHFLISQGLRHDHKFIDVACGSLRLGQYLIPYLDEGCYGGLEGEPDLVKAGLQHELPYGLADLKRPRFAFNYDFDVSLLGRFDRAIAQSLFTHLTPEDIAKCFAGLAKYANPDAIFFVTYFEGDSKKNANIPSHAQLAWHYQIEELAAWAAPSGWSVTRHGDWGHPRKQLMAICRRAEG